MDQIIIREGKREDCKSLVELIQELANFEKMPSGPKLDAETLERDGFGEHPLFYCFVAEINNKLIGYANYYYTYSTWCGKSMFLNDLFVLSAFRNQGIGTRLFNAVTEKAVGADCARLEFLVLNWNPASNFYKNKGVIDLTESEKWHQYQMDSDTMKKYVQNTNKL